MRILVLGTSGAGKTTLARRLAMAHGLKHLELDSIYHQANWTPLPIEEFRASVAEICARDSWVIDGNYSVVQDIVLERATHVVMLDYSRPFVMWRLARRTLTRLLLRQTLWNGNREGWSNLTSTDPEENILLWAWTTHKRRRSCFDTISTAIAKGTELARVRSPHELSKMLRDLK